ncbi:hypothetical protein HMPREF9153_2278 [Cutibacterium avidum ATCC 25577]|uniref:Uncharacterized protein n=1 Tax=Cutibacterium avidum ATCC 25577 TaxID=997355 RepID=G4CYS7_9ACTN|nr:hypothetical protein HMPREF9153_2278 [Cutibacterium avidum ATCC 25577]
MASQSSMAERYGVGESGRQRCQEESQVRNQRDDGNDEGESSTLMTNLSEGQDMGGTFPRPLNLVTAPTPSGRPNLQLDSWS